MTKEELSTMVEDIMSSHIEKGYWGELETDRKGQLVETASMDVLAALGGVELSDIPDTLKLFGFAVAEQAVYLGQYYDTMPKDGRVLTGENIDGTSETYAVQGNDGLNGVLSIRAKAFITSLRRALLGGTLRISRG